MKERETGVLRPRQLEPRRPPSAPRRRATVAAPPRNHRHSTRHCATASTIATTTRRRAFLADAPCNPPIVTRAVARSSRDPIPRIAELLITATPALSDLPPLRHPPREARPDAVTDLQSPSSLCPRRHRACTSAARHHLEPVDAPPPEPDQRSRRCPISLEPSSASLRPCTTPHHCARIAASPARRCCRTALASRRSRRRADPTPTLPPTATREAASAPTCLCHPASDALSPSNARTSSPELRRPPLPFTGAGDQPHEHKPCLGRKRRKEKRKEKRKGN
ncbi:hypothetical protein EUGRSUZ_E04005 [Eucalyptus grandis]|uniref:Uncharacterized protein n=2 Tax=Eucalyptus grandis TaxID=71139 RepID=A0ACC3L2N0_EUCGR|nr:hypothetical protein EUGRSUZ_E04005 [Eucalyptus grandis]